MRWLWVMLPTEHADSPARVPVPPCFGGPPRAVSRRSSPGLGDCTGQMTNVARGPTHNGSAVSSAALLEQHNDVSPPPSSPGFRFLPAVCPNENWRRPRLPSSAGLCFTNPSAAWLHLPYQCGAIFFKVDIITSQQQKPLSLRSPHIKPTCQTKTHSHTDQINTTLIS